MKNLSDLQLIDNVKNRQDDSSLTELIDRHSGLCMNIIKKYSSAAIHSSGCNINDFMDDKNYIIYKAAQDYDPSFKTKFNTFVGNQIRYYCLNKLNKNRLVNFEDGDLELLINNKSEPIRDIREQWKSVVDVFNGFSDKRIKRIFELRYFSESKKDRSWMSIGKKLKLSHQCVIDLHNKALKYLNKKLSKKTCNFV